MGWAYSTMSIAISKKERGKAGVTRMDRTAIVDKLNEWGAKGWELVSAVPENTFHGGDVGFEETVEIYCIFKRRT